MRLYSAPAGGCCGGQRPRQLRGVIDRKDTHSASPPGHKGPGEVVPFCLRETTTVVRPRRQKDGTSGTGRCGDRRRCASDSPTASAGESCRQPLGWSGRRRSPLSATAGRCQAQTSPSESRQPMCRKSVGRRRPVAAQRHPDHEAATRGRWADRGRRGHRHGGTMPALPPLAPPNPPAATGHYHGC